MHKYIIFQAESDAGLPHWKERKLHHTQALTWILAENWDSSGSANPEPGYRPTEYVRVDALHNPDKHGYSTHYRDGDWVVERVEEYTPDLPLGTKFDVIVICYCKYDPINAPLQPMPDRTISAESFGGDEAKYQEYLDSQSNSPPVAAPV